jgi:hypothetical protein
VKEGANVQVKKSWAVISSVAFLAACTQAPSSNEPSPASSAGTSAPVVANGTTPVTINCGEGKQALVKQVSFGGETVSQVECVDAGRLTASRDVRLLDDEPLVVAPAPQPRRTVTRERVVYREPVRDDDVYAPVEEPRVQRTSTTSTAPVSRPAPAPKKRSGEKSAVIIAGSTAAGAGAGAIIGGKKGAIIGAILGGVGGTVYDRKTRNKQ